MQPDLALWPEGKKMMAKTIKVKIPIAKLARPLPKRVNSHGQPREIGYAMVGRAISIAWLRSGQHYEAFIAMYFKPNEHHVRGFYKLFYVDEKTTELVNLDTTCRSWYFIARITIGLFPPLSWIGRMGYINLEDGDDMAAKRDKLVLIYHITCDSSVSMFDLKDEFEFMNMKTMLHAFWVYSEVYAMVEYDYINFDALE